MVLRCSTYCPAYLPGARAGKRERKDLEQGSQVPSLRKGHLSQDRKEVREQATQETAGRMFQAEGTVTEGL